MGCVRRVASEKCSRNQGLSSIPAIFRPDNPHKLPRAGRLTQGELASSQRKILPAAGFAALQAAGKPAQRPVEPIPPGRMIGPTQGLHEATHQPSLKIGGQAFQGSPVECDTSVRPMFEERDTSLGGPGLLIGAHTVCIRLASLNSTRQPQSRPLETGVGIGGVVDPGDVSRLERGRQTHPPHGQERPQETNLRPFDERRHAREPVRAAGPGGAHRNRLGLVVGVMSHQEMKDAALPAGFPQQTIAGVARRLLKTSLRLRTGPVQHDAFDALPFQHARRRPRFAGRFRSQSMIHDQRQDTTASPDGPLVRQQGEAQRIATAGNGDSEMRTCLEGPKGDHQA